MSKSERITFLATPEFKANLVDLARQQDTSVGEVIRGRFAQAQNDAETAEVAELRALTAELRGAIADARSSLREGLDEVEQALTAIRKPAVRERRRKAAVA